MNEIFFAVLKDSLLANFALTLSGEFVYPFILVFGKPDAFIVSIFNILGAIAGLSLTYLITFGLAKLMRKLLESNPGYPTATHYLTKFLPVLCFLTAIPGISVVPAFFCGLAKVNYWKFLLFTAIYRCVYCLYMIDTLKNHF